MKDLTIREIEEFVRKVEQFKKTNPLALYDVDIRRKEILSFLLLNVDKLLDYALQEARRIQCLECKGYGKFWIITAPDEGHFENWNCTVCSGTGYKPIASAT